MPVRSASISVGTSAVALASNSLPDASPWVFVQNLGGGSPLIYLGDSQVTHSTGVTLASNATMTVNTGGGPLYAISDAGTNVVRILELK